MKFREYFQNIQRRSVVNIDLKTTSHLVLAMLRSPASSMLVYPLLRGETLQPAPAPPSTTTG